MQCGLSSLWASRLQTDFTQRNVTFAQIKADFFFIPELAFFVAKQYPLTLSYTFTAAVLGHN